MSRKQKDIFLDGEGDAWFARNYGLTGPQALPADDLLAREVAAIHRAGMLGTRVLEVGCGEGARLEWLSQRLGLECQGIDPSAEAVRAARSRGVQAVRGTADTLPFGDDAFDVVIFGFCLYLCDRDDLFKIAAEADRVLRAPGWLLILDFHSPVSTLRECHHKQGVLSHKMDDPSCFSWHPAYSVFSQRVTRHKDDRFTDDPQEWMATSVLRRVSLA